MIEAGYEARLDKRQVRVYDDEGQRCVHEGHDLQAVVENAGDITDSELPAIIDSYASKFNLKARQLSLYRYKFEARR
jgi:hypothetical protein